MLLGSGIAYLLGCSINSCHRSHIYNENEQDCSCQSTLPVRSHVYCRTSKQSAKAWLISGISALISLYSNSCRIISNLFFYPLISLSQTISQIKTVYAFVGERCSIKSFSECMEKQFLLSKGEALIKGVGTGMFQTVSFCSWALVIWVGAILVTANRAKGGDIIAAVMSILFGAM